MSSAVTACLPPPMPCRQMTIPAAKASKIAMQARTSAPARVESAGTISSAPERTMITAMKVAASENTAMRRAQTASRETGASLNSCRRIQASCRWVWSITLAAAGRSQRHYIYLGKARLGLKRKCNEETSVVKKAVDLDLNAFTRCTAMASAGSEKSARLLLCLSFDTPLLDPRDQHPGMEQAGFCLGRGRRGRGRSNSGDA